MDLVQSSRDNLAKKKTLVDAEDPSVPGHDLRVSIIKKAQEYIDLTNSSFEMSYDTYSDVTKMFAIADNEDRIIEDLDNMCAELRQNYPNGLII